MGVCGIEARVPMVGIVVTISPSLSLYRMVCSGQKGRRRSRTHGLAGGIETDHEDAHLLLAEQARHCAHVSATNGAPDARGPSQGTKPTATRRPSARLLDCVRDRDASTNRGSAQWRRRTQPADAETHRVRPRIGRVETRVGRASTCVDHARPGRICGARVSK